MLNEDYNWPPKKLPPDILKLSLISIPVRIIIAADTAIVIKVFVSSYSSI